MQFDENTIVRVSGLLDSGYTKAEVWRRVDTKCRYNNAGQFYNAYLYRRNKLEKAAGLTKSHTKNHFTKETYLAIKKYIEEENGSWETITKEKGYKSVAQFKYTVIKRAKSYNITFKPGRVRRWTKEEVIRLLEARKSYTWPEVYEIYKEKGITRSASLKGFIASAIHAVRVFGLSGKIAGRKRIKSELQGMLDTEQLDWIRENWELPNARKRKELADTYFSSFGGKHATTNMHRIPYMIDVVFKRYILKEGGQHEHKYSDGMAN